MDAFLSLVLFTFFIFAIMRLVAPHEADNNAGTAPHHELKQVGASGHLPEGVDPVCGMTVAAGEGFLVAHDGIEHRFCSLACVDTFEKSAATQSPRAA
jgi:YHS domain-containing protein